MSSNFNRVNTVHIGDGVNSAAAAVLKLPTLAKGDLVLLDEAYNVIATKAAATAYGKNKRVYIASGNGNPGEVVMSGAIQGNTVSKIGSTKYRAAVTQISHVGYNGTAGAFVVNDEAEYRLNIVFLDDQRPHGQEQTAERFDYSSDANATQEELAFGISTLFGTRKANGTNKTYNGRYVKLEVLTDGAFTASDNAAAVVQGSDRIIFDTAATYNTGTAYAVGDFIRIGGTGTTVAVYKVEKVSGTTLTLNSPYQGVSGTVLAANSGNIASGGAFGFQLTALSPIWNGIDTYEYVQFEASMYEISNANSVPFVVTATQAADGGAGNYGQVYDAEYFAQGYRGVNSRTNWYDASLNPDFLADSAKVYNAISIEFDGTQRSSFQNTRVNPKAAHIFVPLVSDPPVAGEQANETAADFVEILTGYAEGLGFDPIDFS